MSGYLPCARSHTWPASRRKRRTTFLRIPVLVIASRSIGNSVLVVFVWLQLNPVMKTLQAGFLFQGFHKVQGTTSVQDLVFLAGISCREFSLFVAAKDEGPTGEEPRTRDEGEMAKDRGG